MPASQPLTIRVPETAGTRRAQTRGMHTIIRNKKASKSDFVFYSNRLIRLVVEHSLGQLPFHEKVRARRAHWRGPRGCAAVYATWVALRRLDRQRA